MNHELSLRLSRARTLSPKYSFRLSLKNQSKGKLAVPYPEQTSLIFMNPETKMAVEWRTHILESTAATAMILGIGKKKFIRR